MIFGAFLEKVLCSNEVINWHLAQYSFDSCATVQIQAVALADATVGFVERDSGAVLETHHAK